MFYFFFQFFIAPFPFITTSCEGYFFHLGPVIGILLTSPSYYGYTCLAVTLGEAELTLVIQLVDEGEVTGVDLTRQFASLTLLARNIFFFAAHFPIL